jgi:hypothetical protein
MEDGELDRRRIRAAADIITPATVKEFEAVVGRYMYGLALSATWLGPGEVAPERVTATITQEGGQRRARVRSRA